MRSPPARRAGSAAGTGLSRRRPGCRCRRLADRPDPARRQLGPQGPVAADRARRPGPARRPAGVDQRPSDRSARSGAAAARAGRQAGRAAVCSRDGRDRVEVITPLSDELELRYLDWVASRRELVHRASDGRIGYLHVPDMMSAGWAAFHRDLRTEIVRDAVVIDTRDNGGGHTSQLVIEKLARAVIGWDVRRHKRRDQLPAGRPARPAGLAGQRVGRFRRRHRQRHHQVPGTRPGHRHPDLGRRGRHRRPVQAGRRHRR